jgi:hypothetical protein
MGQVLGGKQGVGKPPPSKATGLVSVLSGSFIETTEHALRNRSTATATRILMGNLSLVGIAPIITSASPERVSSFELF